MQFAREGARVDVVEINPAVVPLAQKYFDLDPRSTRPRFNAAATTSTACALATTPPRATSAIILDAFIGDSSPSHLLSREAFAAMRSVLKPGGVLVMDTFGYTEH